MATKKSTKKKSASKGKDAGGGERITVENVNVPGYTTTVDAGKYKAMHQALLKALPDQPPGLTQAEMIAAVKAFLPEDLFPGGAKAGWWVKSVQLDQEAKGKIIRRATKPLRWYRKP